MKSLWAPKRIKGHMIFYSLITDNNPKYDLKLITEKNLKN